VPRHAERNNLAMEENTVFHPRKWEACPSPIANPQIHRGRKLVCSSVLFHFRSARNRERARKEKEEKNKTRARSLALSLSLSLSLSLVNWRGRNGGGTIIARLFASSVERTARRMVRALNSVLIIITWAVQVQVDSC
jgi:hypothetical protein